MWWAENNLPLTAFTVRKQELAQPVFVQKFNSNMKGQRLCRGQVDK
jgi:hypothetical protein